MRMGRLFLSGGGIEVQSKELHKLFVKGLDDRKSLLYLPHAQNVMDPNVLKSMKRIFNPLGILNITICTSIKDKKVEDLLAYSAVFIAGGNTFQLLKELKRSGFDKVLKRYISVGGIIFGESAGAIILGYDILLCNYIDRNEVQLNQFQALNLMSGNSIICHYEGGREEKWIREYMDKHQQPVIAIPELTGIILSDRQIQVIGYEPVTIFQQDKKRIISSNRIEGI